jgi:hypothetical protein
MKKVLVTLDINYPKEITNITFPHMEKYAKNIGAEFLILKERKYPDLPITYEKFQLYDVDADYIIFLDADALIDPNSFDFSTLKSDIIVIAECLVGGDFLPESPPGKNKIRIHSAFLAFSKESKYLVEPHNNPLQYTSNILNPKPEWHLDEYIMSLNLLTHGGNILTTKENFPNTFAHDGNCLTVDQKVKMLKENLEKLNRKKHKWSLCVKEYYFT